MEFSHMKLVEHTGFQIMMVAVNCRLNSMLADKIGRELKKRYCCGKLISYKTFAGHSSSVQAD